MTPLHFTMPKLCHVCRTLYILVSVCMPSSHMLAYHISHLGRLPYVIKKPPKTMKRPTQGLECITLKVGTSHGMT